MKIAIKNSKKAHAVKSWLSLITCAFIVIGVIVAVVDNLLSQPNELIQEVGVKTFRMYTVLSNMLVATTSALCIPFAVEGIRDRNYHLPTWITNLTYIGVTSVVVTFIISLTILAPQTGFVRIMVTEGNLLLHTIVPILSLLCFFFINDYHTVKFKTTLLAVVPIFIYSVVYFISVIVIGEENGGWRDHYGFQDLMPWYVIAIIVYALTWGLALLIRWGHNVMHRLDKQCTEMYYHNAKEYDFPTIEQAIKQLAIENKPYESAGDLVVPRRIIKIFEKKYKSGKPLSYLIEVYVDEYLGK